MIVDFAGHFFDINDRYEGGTALHWLSEGRGFGLDPDILNFLIERGADVLQRHQRTGNTGLHIATVALDSHTNFIVGRRATAFLADLIRAGLGVCDENFQGDTPWDFARRLCVVPRRIFEDALRMCNIDSNGLFIDGEICTGIIGIPFRSGIPKDHVCYCGGGA